MTDNFFDWHDGPVQERGVARLILEHARFEVNDFKSREDDPPDCEAILDGKRSAIEVTRLTNQKARALSMKGPAVYFQWDRDDLLRELQERIDKKEEGVKRYSGGPYDRYVLVFHTAEFVLDKATTDNFLRDATFRTTLFTDVVLGLSYEPGGYPAFRLNLTG